MIIHDIYYDDNYDRKVNFKLLTPTFKISVLNSSRKLHSMPLGLSWRDQQKSNGLMSVQKMEIFLSIFFLIFQKVHYFKLVLKIGNYNNICMVSSSNITVV